MGENENRDPFDLDNDSEFAKKFSENIDKVISDIDSDQLPEEGISSSIEELERSELRDQVTQDVNAVEDQEVDFNLEVDEGQEDQFDLRIEEDSSNPEREDNLAEATSRSHIEFAATYEQDRLDEDKVVEKINERLTDINVSLAEQINEELGTINNGDGVSKKTRPRWFKIQIGILIALLTIVIIGLFLGFTKPGNRILKAMGGKIWETTTDDFDDGELLPDIDRLEEDDIGSEAPEIDESEIIWNDNQEEEARHEDYAYNILLLGEEAIDSYGARGRTDLIIIATLNTKEKKIKLTSLMRDTLVQIPGYADNKLNSAYEKGGVDLLYETIERNFDVKLDGCILVNFDNFERIIDRLGGLQLTLTKSEAKYLKTTNYISKPQYRDVSEGKQTLNGNQVLGYSRIRHRAAITGNNNDYGRTDRHRIILNAIFDKYKTTKKADMIPIMIGILPMLKTDIDSKQFETLLDTFFEIGISEIEDMRVPVQGAFDDNVKVRGMDVLVPDLEKNTKALHEFIFGGEEE